jgi:hypothetical protein
MSSPSIEDVRNISSSTPVVEILEAVLPCLRSSELAGIRKIWLLDREYEPRADGKRLAGRYVPIKGTRMADIELYVQNHVDAMPTELTSNRLFLTWLFAGTFLHELFHHLVRGQGRAQRPQAKAEEAKADRRADDEASRILFILFPTEQYRDEYRRVRGLLDDTGWCRVTEPSKRSDWR